MKTIRLVVFNEQYWGKGLIFTQNIVPLKNLADTIGGKLEVYSFTSIPVYLCNKKAISKSITYLNSIGVDVVNMFVMYYPTRYMLPYWFMFPYFYLNVSFYVRRLYKKDINKDVVYNLRSYQSALAFLKFYKDHNKLVFDPRTDFVEEKINAGYFGKDSLTVKIWNKITRKMVLSFKKTIVISDIFKNNLVSTYQIEDQSRIHILYNPIDYKKFDVPKIQHEGITFLYTGSLGKWNKLTNYIGVFKLFHERHPDSNFIICTNASPIHIDSVIKSPEYAYLSDFLEVHYNVPYDELPSYYARCDYGFQLMNQKDSRVGVKFIEYIAAGVVPIINKNVQGAVFLSEKYHLGVVLDGTESPDCICSKIENAMKIDRMSESYRLFRYLTDTDTICDRIKKIYL